MQIPFAYFSRNTGQAVGDTYFYARRPWAEWMSTHGANLRSTPQHPELEAQTMVKVVPVTIQYVLKIYDNRVAKLESLIDILLNKTIREKTRSYRYDSDVLGINVRYRIELGNPQYDRSPTLKERLSGRGQVYSIVVPFQVYCLLGEGVPVKRVHEVDLTYRFFDARTNALDLRGRPIPTEADKLETIVIDENTYVGAP
jgi:hypothetical protein